SIQGGRADRRGAFRLGVFLFVVQFVRWACKASHVPDLTESALTFAALLYAGFIAVEYWTVYMACEPYVRRHWPHAIVSWTRILSGKLDDPVVGGHILMGTCIGAAVTVLITVGIALAGDYSLRLPSYWMLSGARGTFEHVLSSVLYGITHGL